MENGSKTKDEKTQLEYHQTGSNSAKVVTTVAGKVYEIDLYVCTSWQSNRIDQIRNEVMAELTRFDKVDLVKAFKH